MLSHRQVTLSPLDSLRSSLDVLVGRSEFGELVAQPGIQLPAGRTVSRGLRDTSNCTG